MYHENCWNDWVRVQRKNFKCPTCKRPLTNNELLKDIEEKRRRLLETELAIVTPKTYLNLMEEEKGSV